MVSYGICINNCAIIIVDNSHVHKQLKKFDLVQIVLINDQTEKCSIKLLCDDNLEQFLIYLCDTKNLQIISNDLLSFLIAADYQARQVILNNQNEILNLRMGSQVRLKFINHSKDEYTIEFVVIYVREIPKLGIGKFVGLDFAHFGSLRPFGPILPKLHDMFHYEDDNVSSMLTVRVEQLYLDVILPEKVITKQKTQQMGVGGLANFGQQPESNSMKANSRVVEKNQPCCLCNKLQDLFSFPCSHAFCVKCVFVVVDKTRDKTITCPTCSQSWGEFDTRKGLSSNLGTKIELPNAERKESCNEQYIEPSDNPNSMSSPIFNPRLDDYGNVINVCNIGSDKRCGQCNSLHSLFTFPCSHALCYTCLLNNLDNIRNGLATKCPMCCVNLEPHDLRKFNKFVDFNMQGNSSSIEKKLPLVNANDSFDTSYQYESHTKPKSERLINNIINFFSSKKSEDQYYNAHRSSDQSSAERKAAILRDLDSEKAGLGVGQRQCVVCSTRHDLFSFPCGHAFCITCVLAGLDKFRVESGIKCPNCCEFLKVSDEKLFNNFIDEKMSSMAAKTGNDSHVDYSRSRGEGAQTRSSNQQAEYPRKKATGNKIKIRRCMKCKKDFGCSSIKCDQCFRPLKYISSDA